MSLSSSFRFASFKIPNQIFYQSPLSLGIVNLKPLVPGHVLIIPKRVVPRFRDLTREEVTDLFQSVHQVSRVIELEYKAQALNVALQDGPLAGQSVPHVHIHIIPRKAKDFEPLDEMYNALDAKDLDTEFRQAYTSRPSRDQRKRQEALDQSTTSTSSVANLPAVDLEKEQRQFEVDKLARRQGNVQVPFAGIEDESTGSDQDSHRKVRTRQEMQVEAEWLSRFFDEPNRGTFEPLDETDQQ
ncbi:bis(5'-adenosyl)-triphosphatase [Sporobolomyces koalae]|uniref:bis(5'-adenosyl)-triphosphatase n=1 Tax=Sporobolomyces koalae TaxID=500713 RepID=UPI003170EAD5